MLLPTLFNWSTLVTVFVVWHIGLIFMVDATNINTVFRPFFGVTEHIISEVSGTLFYLATTSTVPLRYLQYCSHWVTWSEQDFFNDEFKNVECTLLNESVEEDAVMLSTEDSPRGEWCFLLDTFFPSLVLHIDCYMLAGRCRSRKNLFTTRMWLLEQGVQ